MELFTLGWPRMLTHLGAAALLVAVLASACDTSGPRIAASTTIDVFQVDRDTIERDEAVALTWQASNVGSIEGTPSCSISRKAANEEAEEPFPVACSGSLTEVPDAPGSSPFMRYQFNVVKAPRDTADPYATAAVTVYFADGGATSIDFFFADATTIVRGGEASLHWRALNPGEADGFAPCRLRRQVEGEPFGPFDAVACEGGLAEVPTVPASSSFVRYELGVLKRPFEADEPYLTRSVNISVDDDNGGEGGEVEWSTQFGTGAGDIARGVAVDGAANVILAGYTSGALGGPHQGGLDAYVTKLDEVGTVLWSSQLGTSADDALRDVAVDGGNNIFITGYTEGSLGGTLVGTRDVYVAKFDVDGNVQWVRQIGTTASDAGWSVATDGAGNAVVVGTTLGSLAGASHGDLDAFVIKLNPDGDTVWSRQIGTTAADGARSVAVDGAGNIFVVGETRGALSGSLRGTQDVFLVKLDPDGRDVWVRQFGSTARDVARGVTADSVGDVIVGGYTVGAIAAANQGDDDAFIVKFDSDGTELWARQLGTSGTDHGISVATDGARNVVLVGYTDGSLISSSQGSWDAFVVKYGPGGNEIWSRQIGTSADDFGYATAIDGAGNVLVAGYSAGALAGTLQGDRDSFVVALTP